MPKSSALQQLTDEFVAWRKSRHGGQPTPLVLRQQAVALRSSHRLSHILAALGINYSTLKRWSAETAVTPVSTFIALPTLAAELKDPDSSNDVLCELPNGVRLTLGCHVLDHTLLTTLSQLTPAARS